MSNPVRSQGYRSPSRMIELPSSLPCKAPRQNNYEIIEGTGHNLTGFNWGERIRTSEWLDQNQLPYHLATPQRLNIYYSNTLTQESVKPFENEILKIFLKPIAPWFIF